MAPILPTPTLEGKYDDEFVEKMIETENREPTEKEKAIIREIKKNKKYFEVKK